MKERELISPFGDGVLMFPVDAEIINDEEQAAIEFLRKSGVSLILNFDITASGSCSLKPKTDKVFFYDNNFTFFKDKEEPWNRDEGDAE